MAKLIKMAQYFSKDVDIQAKNIYNINICHDFLVM